MQNSKLVCLDEKLPNRGIPVDFVPVYGTLNENQLLLKAQQNQEGDIIPFILSPHTSFWRKIRCRFSKPADVIPTCGVCTSHKTVLSTRRHPAHPVSALILHPREIQALWSQNYDADSYAVPGRQQQYTAMPLRWAVTGTTHIVLHIYIRELPLYNDIMYLLTSDNLFLFSNTAPLVFYSYYEAHPHTYEDNLQNLLI